MQTQQPDTWGIRRRGFLQQTGLALIGTSFLTRCGSIPKIPSGQQSVTVPTHEFYGDIEERLDFPGDYELHLMHMAGHDAPVLTPADVTNQLNHPIGTSPLRELAAGKQHVVITFDDMTRPTPTAAVLPAVIEELKRGGIRDENILLLTSYGTHPLMNREEVARKVGKDIVDRYSWLNHNIYENLTEVGRTTRGNVIQVNRHFAAADLRITISGIKVHNSAGYGGGAKAVLPGVAGIETIAYNHGEIGNNSRTKGQLRILQNEIRLDMEEAARLAEVAFSVQIVYNGRREPVGIFSGDIVEAFREACKMANRHYRTPAYPQADIVVANTYPQTMQGQHAFEWHNRSLREGGTAVLILQSPQTMSIWHGLSERNRWRDDRTYWDTIDNYSNPVPKAGRLVIFSQYLQQIDRKGYDPQRTDFASTWDEVLTVLQQRHRDGASVAVYPYACIQHEERDLT